MPTTASTTSTSSATTTNTNTNLATEIQREFSLTSLNVDAEPEAVARLVEFATVFSVSPESLASKFEGDLDKLIAAKTPLKVSAVQSQRPIVNDSDLMAMLNGTGMENLASQRPYGQHKAKLRGANQSQQQQQSQLSQPPRTPLINASTTNSSQISAALSAAKSIPPPKTPSSTFNSTTQKQLLASQQKTPLSARPSTPLAPPAVPFSDRQNKGKLDDLFNPEVPLSTSDSKTPLEISLPPGQQMHGYRYMFERLAEKGDLVDARIQELCLAVDQWVYDNIIVNQTLDMDEEAIQPTSTQVEDSDEPTFKALANPTIPHHTLFYTAGRIVAESAERQATAQQTEPKLTLDTLYLETCRLLGSGHRVQIQLSETLLKRHGANLFPGQILGLAAVNPSGRLLIVQDIFPVPRLDFATTRISRILSLYENEPSRVINMVVAAGPYSADSLSTDAPSYEPLDELVKVLCTEKPDVVILCGPFVDEGLAGWKEGRYTATTESCMKKYIAPALKRVLEASGSTRIVMVPSTRGMESEWVGYPQPPLGSALGEEARVLRWKQFGIKEMVATGNVVLVPNPVQIMVNEVVVTISNVDSLFHLNRDGLRVEPEATTLGTQTQKLDRFGSLFQHHLTQRHLYPLTPSSLNPSDPTMNLFAIDATRAQSSSITLQATPDILILPSALKPLVKNVDGCVCINPGTLVKGRSGGGSYARLCIHPLDIAMLSGIVKTEDGGEKKKVGEKRKGVDGEEEGCGTEEEGVVLEHNVASRCRVEVRKI
ncbi:hypothetical protein BCR33DRAFT_720100 [Rhizoclosmatium globosum]|uniref:DNA polymerase alpha subunit B n=1 Tax=Rhizoclosmatium globosum TaxID=329046 RepID=A0A1Y2BYB6_9FUNG|nr:hypothetical protein BCR33DRAFT_720100 [Rhizoclosmatium globosum]|eukprot:ORY39664.1 hypothetical protein BCR33DRAFT_720100 [Rhizoclosmatium globosum]